MQPPVAARPTLSRDLDRSLVKVESDKGRLRLRFIHGGTRHYIAVGLPNSRVNRIVVQQKATQIELDIASGNFDETLKKYKPPKAAAKKREAITTPLSASCSMNAGNALISLVLQFTG